MHVLDTNVVSEIMRGHDADRGVMRVLDELDDEVVTTVITRAEILTGLALLPYGRKRTRLLDDAGRILDRLVTLPVDAATADAFALVSHRRIAAGRPIASMDALIAAIALVADATLVTRNTRDFELTGIRVVDPWRPDQDGAKPGQ